MKGKTGNEGAKNLCPEGWTALNDAEAKDYILWVGQHLKSQVAEALYTYCWSIKTMRLLICVYWGDTHTIELLPM